MSDYRFPRQVAAVMRSLIPVTCPDGGGGLDDDLFEHAQASIAAAPRHIRLALTAGVVTYDLAAIVHPGVAPLPAHRLSQSDAERYFRWWSKSKLGVQRELAKVLKGFIGMAYYEHPTVRARIGYDPQGWIDKVKKRRLATYSADIEAHEKTITAADPLPTGFFARGARKELERAS